MLEKWVKTMKVIFWVHTEVNKYYKVPIESTSVVLKMPETLLTKKKKFLLFTVTQTKN